MRFVASALILLAFVRLLEGQTDVCVTDSYGSCTLLHEKEVSGDGIISQQTITLTVSQTTVPSGYLVPCLAVNTEAELQAIPKATASASFGKVTISANSSKVYTRTCTGETSTTHREYRIPFSNGVSQHFPLKLQASRHNVYDVPGVCASNGCSWKVGGFAYAFFTGFLLMDSSGNPIQSAKIAVSGLGNASR